MGGSGRSGWQTGRRRCSEVDWRWDPAAVAILLVDHGGDLKEVGRLWSGWRAQRAARIEWMSARAAVARRVVLLAGAPEEGRAAARALLDVLAPLRRLSGAPVDLLEPLEDALVTGPASLAAMVDRVDGVPVQWRSVLRRWVSASLAFHDDLAAVGAAVTPPRPPRRHRGVWV